jgi:energy-coupling factor transporter ATP-binding protein EcfA2
MHVLNDPTPWWGMLRGRPLSIVDLLNGGTITSRPAAAIWWALERGASLFVAAGPPGAGKSTLATALLSFLPEDARVYVTSGPRDRLLIPAGRGPTYLLVNELSWHTPYYLHGPAAQRAFALLRRGIRIVGALHARSVAEAVEVMQSEAELPAADVARVTLVVVLAVTRTQLSPGIVRRVVEVGLLSPDGDEVKIQRVAQADPVTGQLQVAAEGLSALATWAHVPRQQVSTEVASRATKLERWVESGLAAAADIDHAIARFRARTG